MEEKRRLWAFLLVTFAVGSTLQFEFYLHPDRIFWLALSMWAPTVGVLATGRRNIALIARNLKQLPVRQVWMPYALGSLPYLAGFAALVAFGETSARLEMSVGRLFLKIAINPVVTTLLGAVGEEMGWRGYLQPALRRYFSAPVTFLLVGIIWSYWHSVANLAGHNGTQNPVLSTFILFPLMCTAIAFVLGWLRERTDSIWLCALAHGVYNTVSNLGLIHGSSEIVESLVLALSLALTAWLLLRFGGSTETHVRLGA